MIQEYFGNAILQAKFNFKYNWEARIVALVASQVVKRMDVQDFYMFESFEESNNFNIKISKISNGEPIELDIKKSLGRLASAKVWIENDDGFTFYHLFSKCHFNPEIGSILINIHQDLEEHYADMARTLSETKLVECLMLSSTYSRSLFKLLSSSKGPEKMFNIDDLRNLLGVTPNTLKNYADFQRVVVEKGVNLINKITSLKVGFFVNKIYPLDSRSKVKGITFYFSSDKAEFKSKVAKFEEIQKTYESSKDKNYMMNVLSEMNLNFS